MESKDAVAVVLLMIPLLFWLFSLPTKIKEDMKDFWFKSFIELGIPTIFCWGMALISWRNGL